MSGGGSSQTSKTEPWEGLKPYLSDVYSQAQTQYQSGAPYISQFQGMNPGQENALSNIYAKGMTPSALVGDASSSLQRAINTGGNYAASPAMPALMDLAYGGSVPTSLPTIETGFGRVQRQTGDAEGYVGNILGKYGQGEGGDLAAATNLLRLPNSEAYINDYMTGGGANVFAGLSADQLTGALQDQAASGVPMDIAAYQQFGDYKNMQPGGGGQGNPFLEAMFQRSADPIIRNFQTATAPGLDAAFSRAGRYGSGMQAVAQDNAQENLGRALSDTAVGIYGPAYESERARQVQGMGLLQGAYDTGQGRALQAASMAPAIDAYPMQGYAQALNAAGQYQTQDQQRLADQQRLLLGDNAWLQNYAGLLNGLPSGFGTTTQTSGGGASGPLGLLGSAVGLGSGVAQLGGPMGFGWWGPALAASSRTLKDTLAPVEPDGILKGVAALDIDRWAYKPVTPHSVTMPGEHIGPYAEDFKEAFGIGDGMTINLLDAVGVLFAAVKALTAKVQEMEGQRQ